MKYFFVLVFCLSIFGLSISQSDGQSGTGDSSGNSGTSGGTSGGTNSGNTGDKNDGSQGYNQGYSYNTGIRPYQTGYTFYQPFGDAANNQNSAGQQSIAPKTAAAPLAAAQPVLQPIGYQPVYAVPQNPGLVQPIQYQNVPQIVHFGQVPTQGAQPIPVQPIALPNFDGGLPLLDGFGLGGNTPINNNNNKRKNTNNNNNNRAPPIAADFNPSDFGIDLDGGPLGGGGGGGGNNNNGFFSQPNNYNNNNNNHNGYDNLPDDSSLANFANLGGGGGGGGGGGPSNDYEGNDFGNLGDFGSATQNRGTFDIPGFNSNGFFKRK